jgi:hypothetical protein
MSGMLHAPCNVSRLAHGVAQDSECDTCTGVGQWLAEHSYPPSHTDETTRPIPSYQHHSCRTRRLGQTTGAKWRLVPHATSQGRHYCRYLILGVHRCCEPPTHLQVHPSLDYPRVLVGLLQGKRVAAARIMRMMHERFSSRSTEFA